MTDTRTITRNELVKLCTEYITFRTWMGERVNEPVFMPVPVDCNSVEVTDFDGNIVTYRVI